MSLYVSMVGTDALMHITNVHSNNLANVNTVGFRADIENVGEIPVTGDLYNSTSMVEVGESFFDNQPGAIITTGNNLDLAIEGEGWFVVEAPGGGEAYTRGGNFQLTATGALTTSGGRPVFGNEGPITIPPAETIVIGEDGTISIRAMGQAAETLATIDRIKLVKPALATMYKETDGMFRVQGGLPATADATVRVLPGALESSNVNAVSELISVLDSARQYEMLVKLMREFEQMQQTSTEVIP